MAAAAESLCPESNKSSNTSQEEKEVEKLFSPRTWEECEKLEYNFYHALADSERKSKLGANGFGLTQESEGYINTDVGDDPCQIPESQLVKYSLYALQGVSSAVNKLEYLSKQFRCQPADRNHYRNRGLWVKSSSTHALGKLLRDIAHSGQICCQLVKFVEYFTGSNSIIGRSEHLKVSKYSAYRDAGKETEVGVNQEKATTATQKEVNEVHTASSAPFSLVNQAFAIGVKRILEGFLAALNTLTASVAFRRPRDDNQESTAFFLTSEEAGCLTSIMPREITLLELYLHTADLRIHIQTLGHICMLTSQNVSIEPQRQPGEEKANNGNNNCFQDFPVGARLLSYLYEQLQGADIPHHDLLKFLFARACQPYFGFIREWLYEATVKDPYKEFFVEASENIDNIFSEFGKKSFQKIKVREGVSVPCFLKEVCTPLICTGQQLQILLKLLENADVGKDLSKVFFNCIDGSLYSQSINMEGILDGWSYNISRNPSGKSALVYSKAELEDLMKAREEANKQMVEKLEKLFSGIHKICMLNEEMMRRKRVDAEVNKNICTVESLGFKEELDDLYYQCEMSDDNSFHESSPGLDYSACDWHSDAESMSNGSDEESMSDGNDDNIENSVQCAKIHSVNDRMKNEPNSCSSLTRGSCFNDSYSAPTFAIHVKETGMTNSDNDRLKGSEDICFKVFSTNSCHGNLNGSITFSEKERYMMPYDHKFSWKHSNLFSGIFAEWQNIDWRKDDSCKDSCYIDLVNSENFVSIYSLSNQINSLKNFPVMPKDILLESSGTEVGKGSSADYKASCALIGLHPTLTRKTWIHLRHLVSDRSSCDRMTTYRLHDFSSVTIPFEMFSKSLPTKDSCLDPSFSASADIKQRNSYEFMDRNAQEALLPLAKDRSELHPGSEETEATQKLLKPESECYCDNINTSDFQLNTSQVKSTGGARWNTMLNSPNFKNKYKEEDLTDESSNVTMDIPLDVVVDQCIIQEILLQYQNISKFTVKLFVEGFGLQQHLLAFRRYFLMEAGDWADEFVMHLYQHRWSLKGNDQRILELQAMLELSLQRSSCEGDEHAERLYIYINAVEDKFQVENSLSDFERGLSNVAFIGPTSIRAFDFIGLGYRLDWPLNMVLSSDALDLYGRIFHFLVQIRMAVFCARDIWNNIKVLTRQVSRSKTTLNDNDAMDNYRVFMQFGQQLNHFIGSLQQYIQSQLLHVVWHKFLYNFNHQVEDMLDLEIVHHSYLSEALHICFLSSQARPIRELIFNIMQCITDFSFCFNCRSQIFKDNMEFRVSQMINLNQALKVKRSFEQNLRQLYENYAKFSDQTDSSLNFFWMHLDYNEFIASSFALKTKQHS